MESESEATSNSGNWRNKGAPMITNNIKTSKLTPFSDGAASLVMTKADGTTPVLSLNTSTSVATLAAVPALPSQTQKYFLAAPNAADGVPSFRAIVASDVPALSYEPVISPKLTAFNKNYGTTATDVKMNGTQGVGSIDAIARIDHVHPVDTSRQVAGSYETAFTNLAYSKLPTGGGTWGNGGTLRLNTEGSAGDGNRLLWLSQTTNDYAASILMTGKNSSGTDHHVLLSAGNDGNFYIGKPGEYAYSGAKALTITNGGNVGIGCTPASTIKLDVAGNARILGTGINNEGDANDIAIFTNTANYGADVGASIKFVANYNTGSTPAGFATIGGVKENATGGNYAGALRFLTRVSDGNLTEKMRITSGGNLGLGCTPSQLLELNGASSPCLLIKDTTNNVISYLYADDSSGYVGTASNHDFKIKTNDTVKMTITSGGNVGIGCTPSTLFEASSDAGAIHRLSSRNTGAQDAETIGKIEFWSADGDRAAFGANIGAYVWAKQEADGNNGRRTCLLFGTNDVNAAAATAMTITGGGYVGIGCTPRIPFETRSGLGVPTPIANDIAAGSILFTHYNGSVGSVVGVYDSPQDYATYFQARNMAAGGGAKNLVLQPLGGNVGIGCTPTKLLHCEVPHAINQDNEIRIGSTAGGIFYGLGLNYQINSAGTPARKLVEYNDGTKFETMTFALGNVGIGCTPGYQLELSTDSAAKPRSDHWTISSDARLKQDIADIVDPLSKLLSLKGRTFKWIPSERSTQGANTQMGFIAQEVETVFPDWIGSNNKGTKNITSVGMDALVVESIRALNAKIEALENRIKILEAK